MRLPPQIPNLGISSTMKLSWTAALISFKHIMLIRRIDHNEIEYKAWQTLHQTILPKLPKFLQLLAQFRANHLLIRLLAYLNEKVLPGDLNHILFRKKWIKQQINDYASLGTEKVIFLGSGFDALAYDMAFEGKAVLVDRTLERLEDAQHLLNYDLNETSQVDALFDELQPIIAKYPTLFVTEGLLDYLPDCQAVKLIQFIKQKCLKHKAVWLSTAFIRSEMPQNELKHYKMATSLVGEQLKFEYSMQKIEELEPSEGLQFEVASPSLTASEKKASFNSFFMNGFKMFKCYSP